MKSRSFSYFIVIVLIGAIVFSVKPGLLFLVQRQLKKELAADVVSIQKIKFRNFNEIRFLDIKVEKNGFFVFQAQEAGLQLRLFDPLKRNVLKVTIKSASLDIKQPKHNIADVKLSSGTTGEKKISLPELELVDLALNLQFKDLKVGGRFSIDIDLAQQEINSIYVDIANLDFQDAHVEKAILWVTRGNERGEFNVSKVTYNKVVATEIKSLLHLEQKNLIFDDLSAKVFDGAMSGNAVLKLIAMPEYEASLKFVGLNIPRFVADFELEKKFTMTGKIDGQLHVKGVGANVTILGGDFLMQSLGGILTITDKSFLENIASRTSINYDIVVQSLQEYHYNTGAIKVFLEKDAVMAEIAMDGEKGPKHFIVANHFNFQKDGL